MLLKVEIIHEDPHIIVCVKPPKVPSQSDPSGDPDMLSVLKAYLDKANPENPNKYLSIVHRLDRPVGGLMVFAKTKPAAASLSKQIQERSFKKRYLAVTCGILSPSNGKLENHLKRLSTINLSKVVSSEHQQGKRAVLTYKTHSSLEYSEFGPLALVEIELETGRHHQIRVQLSHAGCAIWGDNKYNKTFVKQKSWTQIALWACGLSFVHPHSKRPVNYHVLPYNVIPFSLLSTLPSDALLE
jgi:23S rRNA pseudouridine1911/1915/1917 synthase